MKEFITKNYITIVLIIGVLGLLSVSIINWPEVAEIDENTSTSTPSINIVSTTTDDIPE